MKKINILICITSLFASHTVQATEITPLYGYRTGGDFVDTSTDIKHTINNSNMLGFIISTHSNDTTYELYYSHQSSELQSIGFASTTSDVTFPLAIDYLHIGGTVPISDEGNFNTFLSGGLGFTYMSPDFVDTQSELRPSFSIGLGMLYPITKRVALRLEARGFATLFANNSVLFCNGGCSLSVNGSFLLQGEVFAGVAISF